MARIPMTSGFTLIPEGTHVFRIYDATYDEKFGKIKIDMITAQGITYQERFSVLGGDGQFNEKALNAFSYFAKTALNNYAIEDVDPEELIGHYIEMEITHTQLPSNKDPNKTVTFANSGYKSPIDGFIEAPVPKALAIGRGGKLTNQATAQPVQQAPTAQVTGLNIDELLG